MVRCLIYIFKLFYILACYEGADRALELLGEDTSAIKKKIEELSRRRDFDL